MEPNLLTQTDGGVRTVTLARPQKRNALDSALIDALSGALRDAEGDDDVRCVVLTGQDPAFCSGLDLDEVRSGVLDVDRLSSFGDNPWEALARMRTPVIAAVNGPCVTAGLELMLRCHFAIASERARFADRHAEIGIHPGNGLTGLLPQTVGLRRARQLSLTGEFVTGRWAFEMNLVNEVVPHEELLDRVYYLAGLIADNDPVAVQTLNDTYRQVSETTLGRGLALEHRRFREWPVDPEAIAKRIGERDGKPGMLG